MEISFPITSVFCSKSCLPEIIRAILYLSNFKYQKHFIILMHFILMKNIWLFLNRTGCEIHLAYLCFSICHGDKTHFREQLLQVLLRKSIWVNPSLAEESVRKPRAWGPSPFVQVADHFDPGTKDGRYQLLNTWHFRVSSLFPFSKDFAYLEHYLLQRNSFPFLSPTVLIRRMGKVVKKKTTQNLKVTCHG